MKPHNAAPVYGGTAFAIAAVGAWAIGRHVPGVGGLAAWVVSISVVALLVYGLDKRLARKQRTRVPESILYGLALSGGVAGALAGMVVFRHKTSKRSFRWTLGGLLFLEAMLIGAWLLGWLEGIGLSAPIG